MLNAIITIINNGESNSKSIIESTKSNDLLIMNIIVKFDNIIYYSFKLKFSDIYRVMAFTEITTNKLSISFAHFLML